MMTLKINDAIFEHNPKAVAEIGLVLRREDADRCVKLGHCQEAIRADWLQHPSPCESPASRQQLAGQTSAYAVLRAV